MWKDCYNHILISIAVLCVINANAQQSGRLVFSNYSTEHGLCSPEVYCVMQDSKGFMWFGTDQGVSRFDGYKFYNFGKDQGLTSHVVFNILEDHNKDIWLSSMTGEVFIYKDGKLSDYPYNDCILQYNKNYYSSKLLQIDKEGTAYFDLKYVGLLRIDRHGNTRLFTSSLPYQYLIVSIQDMIFPTIVYRADEIRLSAVPVPDDPDYYMPVGYYLNDSTVQSFYKAEHLYGAYNTFLVDTARQIHLISLHNNFIVVQGTKILADNKDKAQINNIEITPKGEIYCAMHNKAGLRKYENLSALIENKYSVLLPDKFCSMIRFDNDGGLWVSTLENGIYYCKNPGLYVYDQNSGLSDDYILSLAIANEHQFFLGLRNGNIAFLDLKNSICREINYAEKYKHLPFNLFYDSNSNNLLCGAAWMDMRLNSYPYQKTGLTKGVETNIFKFGNFKFGNSPDANSIFCINYTSLHKIHLNNYMHEVLSEEKDRNKMYAVHLGNNGTLWIGRQSGLFYYEDDSIKHFRSDHPALNNRIEDLAELADTTLLLGTKGFGLVLMKDNKFRSLTKKDGLVSDFINDLYTDQNGTLWVATNMGLNRVDFDGMEYKIKQFSTSNGLPANEVFKIASYNDKVWIATRKGLVCVTDIEGSPQFKNPHFSGFNVGGQYFQQMPSKIKYKDNDIKIEFITINYKQEGRIPYRHRLNKDLDWNYSFNPQVEYLALGNGKYNFEVQSQDESGNWTGSSLVYFHISPPWWLDWSVWLMFAFLTISGSVLYTRLRIRHYNSNLKIKTEISDLERKAIQAQMNPHFIFNALNSIQSFIISEDKVSASHYLQIFSSLIRKTLAFSERKEIPIDEIKEFLDQYLSLEQLRFENKFSYIIKSDPHLDGYETCMPPLLIQPLVENAVIHAFNNRTEKGLIHVEFNSDEESLLTVIVTDNGSGIHQTAKENGHQSFGIQSIRRRLEILDAGSGKYGLHISNNENGKGTIAILRTGIKIIPTHVAKKL